MTCTHRASRPVARRSLLVVLTALILSTGCGDDDGCCDLPPADRSSEAAYAGAGPYPVGVTTLQLSDRLVEVWYPAAPGSEAGVARATYKQNDPLDTILRMFVENIALREGINLIFETRAFRELPPSLDAPFALVVFSHGFGGWRNINSSAAAGIASWGFVVAAPDYLERGLNAVATNTVMADPLRDRAITIDTLDLLRAANGEPGGRLFGLINFDHVGIAGHSAGGRTALDVLDLPEVDVAVGHAAAGGQGGIAKPTMLIVARNDIAITPEFSEELFAMLASPKRLVIIDEIGHNSFSDSCVPLREGASLTQLAMEAGLEIDARLLELAANGCSEADLPPDRAWAITQHFTVAQLRETFGIDDPPVGLGSGVVRAFSVGIDYRQE
jgi:dienelactone hydrolase